MTRKIISIGGGAIGSPKKRAETKPIDREVVRLTGKKKPRALFIPTASEDAERYCTIFEKAYEKLGCTVEHLLLYRNRPSKAGMKRMIDRADLIYVGGGDTLRMMKLWRRLGVDTMLRRAAKRGTVLAGLSAGAICWFEHGNSDSLKYGPQKKNKLIKVRGLGLASGTVCPHYDAEKDRKPSVHRMVRDGKGPVIALDNCAAIEIVDDKYRILTSKKKARGLLVKKQGKIVEEPLSRRFVSTELLA